jgi:hypothetical protein
VQQRRGVNNSNYKEKALVVELLPLEGLEWWRMVWLVDSNCTVLGHALY